MGITTWLCLSRRMWQGGSFVAPRGDPAIAYGLYPCSIKMGEIKIKVFPSQYGCRSETFCKTQTLGVFKMTKKDICVCKLEEPADSLDKARELVGWEFANALSAET